jgi:hypothetical protein
MSIEHIYPENPQKDVWKPIEEEYIKNIGNLVLLDAGLNSKIGNVDFQTKKKIIIEESQIISTKEVFNKYNDWSEKEINQRRNELVDYLFNNIWE